MSQACRENTMVDFRSRFRWLVRFAVLGAPWLPIVVWEARAADCPQWGGGPARNHVAAAKDLAATWDVGAFDENSGAWQRQSAKNIRWVARLGSQTYGTPVIADGKVFCATNNAAGWVKRYPADVDLGCLLCFRESDGQFLWQFSREKLSGGRALDWPETGICDSPLVEGKRLWLVTNRCEVVCLATDGRPAGEHREASVLWSYDMIRELGVVPHNMTCCSVTAAGDLLLVGTSNGVDESHQRVPAAEAPSFIALDKATGRLVWADRSPGGRILHGQWSSPAYAVIGGVPQAIFAGGDGWLYSFRAERSRTAAPELLWRFDCNPKRSVWKDGGSGDRNSLVATPVVCGECVYLAVGDDPEFGEGPGRLWKIDATRRGDVSPDLVFDRHGQPAPLRRLCAVDSSAGEVVRPNANSAAVWEYVGRGGKDPAKPSGQGAGKRAFEDTMHRTLGMAVVKDDLLVIADLAGVVHCLDAKTAHVHWTYDLKSAVWGSPLVADGKIYLGDEDGEVAVFELAPRLKLVAKNRVADPVYTTPVTANDSLYIATRNHLIAIRGEKQP
jgi:outer membrane protein assembly factor BamB